MEHLEHLFAPGLPGSLHAEAGEVLARRGDSGGALFFLQSGTAARALPGGKPTPLQPGMLFGEEALLLGRPYAATLVALTELTALALTRETLPQLLAASPGAGLELLALVYLSHAPADAPWPALPPSVRVEAEDAPAEEGGQDPAPSEVQPEPPQDEGDAPPVPAAQDTAQEWQESLASAGEPTDLFPEGHGIYSLELDNASPLLYQKSQTCPMCKHAFKATAVRASKLVAERTDDDMRVHYAGIEPLHYEVVTCPKCWYSASVEQFEQADRRPSKAFFAAMQHYQDTLPLQFDAPPDDVTVFASYYLALRCAPLCFYRHQSILSRLWVKLGRLYEDCGDTAMWRSCCEQALENYLYLYEKTDVPPAQLQQICYMMGELNYRLGNLREARKFFFEAKTDPLGSPAVKRMADRRIAFIMDDLQEPEEYR